MSVPGYIRDVCQQANHASVVWENKIYVLGGYNVIEKDGSVIQISNSYLRILDFTKSADTETDNITSIIRMPDTIPRTKWPTLWANNGKLLLFGGAYELYSRQTVNGDLSNATQPALDGTVWEYDTTSANAQWAISSTSDMQPVSQGQSAFVSKEGVGYIFAGFSGPGIYYLGNGTSIPANAPPEQFLSNMLTYDSNAKLWTNETNSVSFGTVEVGKMIFFESLGKAGAFVLIGGYQNDVNVKRPMDSINVYDIDTKTWYTQKTTAEAGNFPASRREFCGVGVSAADGTSHNIYVYGGINQDNIVGTDALSDVWILTLPYFHWVNVGKAPLMRESFSCELLSEKYLVSYRGRRGLASDDYLACDDVATKGISMLDITTLNWTTTYELSAGTPSYKLPKTLYSIIGGGANGNATTTAPKNGFVDDKLQVIFEAAVSTNTAPSSTATSNSGSASSSNSGDQSKSTPVGAIVGGVIGGLIVLATIFFALIWYRRRKNSNPQLPAMAELGGHGGMKHELPGDSNGIPNSAPPHELPSSYQRDLQHELPGFQEPMEMDSVGVMGKPVSQKPLLDDTR